MKLRIENIHATGYEEELELHLFLVKAMFYDAKIKEKRKYGELYFSRRDLDEDELSDFHEEYDCDVEYYAQYPNDHWWYDQGIYLYIRHTYCTVIIDDIEYKQAISLVNALTALTADHFHDEDSWDYYLYD